MNHSRVVILLQTFLFSLVCAFNLEADVPDYLKDSAPWVGHDLIGKNCTGPAQGYGPWDYTNPDHRGKQLSMVEGAHFNDRVESLTGGTSKRRKSPVGDMRYTLNAFPNHHRALYSMMRYQLKNPRPADARYAKIECYFQRAIGFKPDDYRVMQLYAYYLNKKKHPKMALETYKRALSIKDAPVDINYSLGLLYFDLKEYDMAVEQAKIAYGGGIKKSKLKNKLKKIKRWPVE